MRRTVVVLLRRVGGKSGKFQDPRTESVGLDEVSVGGCGEHEAPWHMKPCLGEFAEVGSLASGFLHVAAPELVKVLDVGHDRASLLPGPLTP
ncbi:hypothetical protein SRABI83_02737 [Arthrobacter sp. Bi83]|nr:hypothetical protein SRABI83_02737 [Arthrobacter sp. Bi83]